jgi:UDP-glucose 4-epimerase
VITLAKKKNIDLAPKDVANTNRYFNKQRKMLKKLKRQPWLWRKYEKLTYPDGAETQTGSPLAINITLDKTVTEEYDNQPIYYKVAEHFINKAGTIVIMDCPCRTFNHERYDGCKHRVDLGCIFMGKGAAKMDLSKFPGAKIATKEEALERVRLGYEDGLVTHIGKYRGDARHYGVLEYENELQSICQCCNCCCIVGMGKYGPPIQKKTVKRMEGVTVHIDPEKCTGCGACFKVCIYDGLRMKKGKATIKDDHCMGCGRCEMTCPSDAVTITIDSYDRINEVIARFEERVDISG